jgi:ferredoxin
VTLLDGVLAMEGQGPGKGGSPRRLGMIMAATDAAAMDMTVCRMLGLAPESLLTNRMATEMGIISHGILIDGEIPEIKDFRLPEITPLVFGPKSLHGFMRRHLVQRPLCEDPLCRLCGECSKYCPARAITVENKKLRFDYDACIRCYCCIEVCPHGALRAVETIYGRMTRKILMRHDD